jgi:hypothetical protein
LDSLQHIYTKLIFDFNPNNLQTYNNIKRTIYVWKRQMGLVDKTAKKIKYQMKIESTESIYFTSHYESMAEIFMYILSIT